MKFSIDILTCNGGEMKECINFVFNQVFLPVEIFIIDDENLTKYEY
ncbi:hypothetical protein J7K44_00805 [bacterium]|nr:hypothetical protein [bacterium]